MANKKRKNKGLPAGMGLALELGTAALVSLYLSAEDKGDAIVEDFKMYTQNEHGCFAVSVERITEEQFKTESVARKTMTVDGRPADEVIQEDEEGEGCGDINSNFG
jgi:hypothetical protein